VSCPREFPVEGGILELLTDRKGAPGYDPHYFESLSQVEQTHFWYVARRELILAIMRRTIPDLDRRALFDIGCGSGGLLSFLGASGIAIAGAADAYRDGLRVARTRLGAPLILTDEGTLPPLGGGLGMVSLFDVLEHLDDDVGVLRFAHSVLEPGGYLVLTVPAHPFLFDEMDVLAFHRRRYRLGDLAEKLREAGLEVRALTHFMSPLVPGLLLVRALGRLGRRPAAERRNLELQVHPLLNPILLGLLRLERPVAERMRIPFGTSLIAVAERPRVV
jgi:SAM-dependent methyltransferase